MQLARALRRAGGRPSGVSPRAASSRCTPRACSDLLHGTGRETFEAVKMLKSAGAARLTPANGADYPRGRFGEALRQIAQLVRADVGLRDRVRRRRAAGTRTSARAPSRASCANRLREFGAALAAFAQRPRRPDGGRGRADHVGVRPHGRRERQPRHRPRPRHRDARRWAAASAAATSTAAGPASPPSNASKAATSPSPPTSAPSSARSPPATSRCRPRPRSSPGWSPPARPLGVLA